MTIPYRTGQGSGWREIKWSLVAVEKNALVLRVEGATDIAQLCGCTDAASHSCACPHFRFDKCEDCENGRPGKHFATCPFGDSAETLTPDQEAE